MSKEMKNSVKFGGFVRLTIVQYTNEEAHDPAVEVCRLADNDEGGAEGEEGPDDQHTAGHNSHNILYMR